VTAAAPIAAVPSSPPRFGPGTSSWPSLIDAAKRIMAESTKMKLADLTNDTVDKFTKVINATNGIMADWRKQN
jgi:hypothetical protein